ncbi:MAG: amino acid ABC transporter permease [Acidobacteriota bacterium]
MDVFYAYREAFLQGFLITVELSVIMIVAGTIIGILWGILATSRFPLLKYAAVWSYEIIRAVPALVLLFWFHYPFQRILDVSIDPFITSGFVFTILNASYIADYVRNGILNVHRGQVEAAESLGIPGATILRRITLPEVLRSLLPTFVGQNVHMMKTIPLASMISVGDLFRVAQQVNAYTYKTVEVYSVVAIVFILMILPLTFFGRRLETSKWFLRRTA